MAKFTLTNQGYMGLGIIIGFKSGYRKSEAASFGIDINDVMKELEKVNIAKNGRVNMALAKQAWSERFGDQLGSQTHQYADSLGYNRFSHWG